MDLAKEGETRPEPDGAAQGRLNGRSAIRTWTTGCRAIWNAVKGTSEAADKGEQYPYRGREERLIQKQDQDKRPRWIKSHGAPCVTLTLTRESALDWPTDAHRGLTRIKVGFPCNFSFPFPLLRHFANPLRRSLSPSPSSLRPSLFQRQQ